VRTLLTAAFILFVAFAPTANAVQFDVEGGVRQYGIVADGTWYQEAFPHKLDITGLVWSIGARWHLKGKYYFRLAWTDLGSVRSDAAAVVSDEDYANGAPYTTPVAQYVGNGRVYGLYASVLSRPETGFLWEVGLGAYKPQWRMDVYNWRSHESLPGDDFHFKHTGGWQVGPKFAAGYGWANGWEVLVSTYWVKTKGSGNAYHPPKDGFWPSLYSYGHGGDSLSGLGTFALTVRKVF